MAQLAVVVESECENSPFVSQVCGSTPSAANFRLFDSKMAEDVKNAAGKMEETIGNVTRLESLQTTGKERQVEGQVEDKQVRAQGYADGTVNYITDTLGNVAGPLTGDTPQEVSSAAWFPHTLYLTDCPVTQGIIAMRRTRCRRRQTSRDPPSKFNRVELSYC